MVVAGPGYVGSWEPDSDFGGWGQLFVVGVCLLWKLNTVDMFGT